MGSIFLPQIVLAGLRVAICDQLEDPKMTKTIVKRGVTELVTPGVSMNDEVLQAQSNNFIPTPDISLLELYANLLKSRRK